MTESIQNDKSSYLGLLNGFLLPEMAQSLKEEIKETDNLSWHYLYNYVKLLTLCIEKENPGNNTYYIATLLNFNILATIKPFYHRLSNIKPFKLAFIQFISSLLYLDGDNVVEQVKSLGLLNIVWETFEETKSRKNVLYSACLRVFTFLELQKASNYLVYFGEQFGKLVAEKGYDSISTIRRVMDRYRKETNQDKNAGSIEGEFSPDSISLERPPNNEMLIEKIKNQPLPKKIADFGERPPDADAVPPSHQNGAHALGKRESPSSNN